MYINPFFAGVLCTIGAEALGLLICVIVAYVGSRKRRKNK
jgi:hypothetical protein